MKNRPQILLVVLVLMFSSFQFTMALAQGTAFTYQGRLNDGVGPANGNYDLRFTVYDSLSNGLVIGEPITNAPTPVTNGLFTVALDFGVNVFTGPARWLDIGVRTNGSASAYQTLNPRQPFTATPYSVTAGNLTGLVPAGALSGSYPGAISLNNPANVFDGNGAGLTSLNASQLTSGTVPVSALGNAWQVSGNTGTSPTNGNFVGTTDFQPLELKAGGMRVLRLEPDGRTNVNGVSGNLIGGCTNNMVQQPGSGADFIGSGGFPGGPNIVLSNSAGVFIGAGSANQIGPNLNDAFIGAGFGNSMGGGANRSVIGGGEDNTNNEFDSVIGGGQNNYIQQLADHSFIGGGQKNSIVGSTFSVFGTIMGGYGNTMQTNVSYCVIGGGYGNTIQSNAAYSVVGGGLANTLGYNVAYATIGGGTDGNVGSSYATIGGGGLNSIGTNSDSGTISGGYNNIIGNDTFDAAIGGGSYHTIGTNSYYSTIGGGRYSSIGDNATASAIGGGFETAIDSDSAYSTVGGGYLNTVGFDAAYATIGGGYNNQIAFGAFYSAIPGGYNNYVGGELSLAAGTLAGATNYGSFVWADASDFLGFGSTTNNQFSVRALGGVRFVTGGAGLTVDGLPISGVSTVNDASHSNILNVISGSPANSISAGIYGATIAGGGAVNYNGTDAPNSVTADFGTISGGLFNQCTGQEATVGGGSNNIASGLGATVGGGAGNTAGGNYSVVPGGYQNQAIGNYSLAAGDQAQAANDGAFVWADSQNAPFSSTGTNQFLIRASGGVGINTNNPGTAALNVAGKVSATTFQGDGSGLFNVSAGALGNYVFGYNNGTQTVATPNTFQDVNFSVDAQLNGWTHLTGTSQYTNAQTGLYLVQYFAQVESTLTTGTNAQVRALVNGTEIPGSRSVTTLGISQFAPISKSLIANLNSSDVLTIQFTGSSTGVRLFGTANSTLTVTRIQ